MANFAPIRLAISSTCPLSLTWVAKGKSQAFYVRLNFAFVFDFLKFAYFTCECLPKNEVLFTANPSHLQITLFKGFYLFLRLRVDEPSSFGELNAD